MEGGALMQLNKMNPIELTELIKENYSYNGTDEFYNVQDIINITDALLRNETVNKEKLLNEFKALETRVLKQEL